MEESCLMTNCQIAEAIFSARHLALSSRSAVKIFLRFGLLLGHTFIFFLLAPSHSPSLSLPLAFQTRRQKAHNADVLENWVIKTHDVLPKSIHCDCKHCRIWRTCWSHCKVEANCWCVFVLIIVIYLTGSAFAHMCKREIMLIHIDTIEKCQAFTPLMAPQHSAH